MPWKSRWAREALDLAGRIGHPNTLAHVLLYVAIACLIRGDVREALAVADRLMAFVSERSIFVEWNRWAMLLRGYALAGLGRPREGLALAQGVLELWNPRCSQDVIVFGLTVIAICHLYLGQSRDALAALDELMARGVVVGPRMAEAGRLQIRGEALRQLGREEEASACFIRAIAVAREQEAGLFELRATVSLCRQLRDRGRPEAARRMLERVYGRFEGEGECPDLEVARALLADCERTLSYG